MNINGIDVESLFESGNIFGGTKLEFLDYEITHPSYNRFITTTDNDVKIVNRRVSIGINMVVVRFVLYDTKENCYLMASKVASMLGDALVDFGGMLTYRVQIATDGSLENLAHNMYLYRVQLQVLDKMGEEVVVNTTSATPINLTNVGTYQTPIRIEVTPTVNMASFSVYGFGAHNSTTPLVVSKASGDTYLPLNKKIIIDGDASVLQETTAGVFVNKFADTNLLSFPVIPEGVSQLVFAPTNGLTIKIIYKPRYV